MSLWWVTGCGDRDTPPEPSELPAGPVDPAPPEPPPPPPIARPVPLYVDGQVEREVDGVTAEQEGYLLLDLGDSWTPYLFSERDAEGQTPTPHQYRETYLALARGEYPRNHHGRRARADKYLELYGIMPTLGLLRARFAAVAELECAASLDLEPLQTFDGFIAYRNNAAARRRARAFRILERQVGRLAEAQGVTVDALEPDSLRARDAYTLRKYREQRPKVEAIRAAQDRLACEGYFENRPKHVRGAMDWVTHEALAEFERRHRVYGWGFIGRDTIHRLRQSPIELEREAVIRVLVERAMHAFSAIEDGSAPGRRGEPRMFRGSDGQMHPVPNLEAELRSAIIDGLGLETTESTLGFLTALGELPRDGQRWVALRAPSRPEYYADDMEIEVDIDRGDVWYEFPYGDEGRERAQPVSRRPRMLVYVVYNDQRIPIARFGTTIGGWRSEEIEGERMWRYKNSPVGRRIWQRIVSAPVWLAPPSTPAGDLLVRRHRRGNAEDFEVNYHEIGPSYASAYGLVAAYHLRYARTAEGELRILGDEGIRSHGSVDYMSIMRRHSHGCHRLHNHIAVRLMSWVLAHRHHERVGHRRVGYRRFVDYEDHRYTLEVEEGGYEFVLERPVHVNVLEGRIRGSRRTPVEGPLPQYSDEMQAYVLPDGGTVRINRHGGMTPYTPPDAGVDGGADGGLYAPVVPDRALPADAGVPPVRYEARLGTRGAALPSALPAALPSAPRSVEGALR